MEAVCKFFVSIWLLLLLWIIFCGDSFDGGAGNICFRTGITCYGGVTRCSFKEATSFFNRFVSCYKFCLVSCVFYRRCLMLLKLRILVNFAHVYFVCL